MFVGHGLLAFAIAAGVAHAMGRPPDRALRIGLIAGAFGLVPDVDVLYAPVGLLGGLSPDAFWAAGNVVHRTVTHSLPIGVVAAVAVWLVVGATRAAADPTTGSDDGPTTGSDDGPTTGSDDAGLIADATGILPQGRTPRARLAVAYLLLAGIVVVAGTVSGPLAAFVAGAFAVATGLVALAAAKVDLGPAVAGATALVGLLAHPFGDLFTGTPPAMAYPFDVILVAERILLHPDPTLHLLGAMGLELATAWLAVLVYLRICGHRPREFLTGRAGLGAGYVAIAPLVAPPTLAVSYHFVYSVLAVGLIAATVSPTLQDRPDPRQAAVTGLAAVSLATVAYGAVYLVG